MHPQPTLSLFCLLFPVLFFPLLSAQERPTTNCGYAFTNLTRNCAHPILSTPQNCCPAIDVFNSALCWCQPYGLAASTLLAANQYALALRAHTCDITQPFRPAFFSRDGPSTLDTCPPDYVSLPPQSKEEFCANPEDLRRKRLAVLAELDALTLAGVDPVELGRFKAVIPRLFSEEATLSSVGLWSNSHLINITDFLLSRQAALGSPLPWVPGNVCVELRDRFWGIATVSYALDFAHPDGFLATRFVFASFQNCSELLLDLYLLEPGVVDAMSAQYYYTAEPKDAVSMYNVSADEICQRIDDACGELSPYQSLEDCVNFMKALKLERKVMCNRFDQEKTPTQALFGNTTACRYNYALIAKADPERYCPLIGKEPSGICSASLCNDDQFDDIFGEDINPRYDQGTAISCDAVTGECFELWPIDDSSEEA